VKLVAKEPYRDMGARTGQELRSKPTEEFPRKKLTWLA